MIEVFPLELDPKSRVKGFSSSSSSTRDLKLSTLSTDGNMDAIDCVLLVATS